MKMIFHSRWGVGLDYVDTEVREMPDTDEAVDSASESYGWAW